MKNLFNFFFSFDKLMKEGLVRAFYWLSLIVLSLTFLDALFESIRLGPLADVFSFFNFFAIFLLSFVSLRLIAELAIALFRINDNVSPDGGKSETANIDPVAEARRAAEQAAKRAQDMTKTAVDKTSAATKSASDKARSAAHDVSEKVSDAAEDMSSKAKSAVGKDTAVKPVAKASGSRTIAPEVTLEPQAPKRRGRPKGSKNKTSASAKPTAKKSATKTKTATSTDAPKRRGRPKGSKNKPKTPGAAKPKLQRAPGMKKDGTPRKKPGPKPKS